MKVYTRTKGAIRLLLLRRLQPCSDVVPLMSDSLERRLRLGERIDRLGIARLGNRWTRTWRELAVLPLVVDESEQLCDIIYAHLMFHAGLLLLTDRRLVYIWFRMFRPGWDYETIALDTITRIELNDQRKFGEMKIFFPDRFWTGEPRRYFHRMKHDEMQRFRSELAAQLECIHPNG